MTPRETFINYVKNGAERHLCSLQIGAGAGYDAKIAGHIWTSDATLADTIAACARYPMTPLFNIGLPDPGDWNPLLRWETVREVRTDERREYDYRLVTPHGTLTRSVIEEPRSGCVPTKYPVTDASDLRAFEWVVDAMFDGDHSVISRQVAEAVRQIDGRGALSVQWAMQPYEMFCYPNILDTMFLAQDEPVFFRRLMDKLTRLSFIFQDEVARGGADFVFLGGSAREMISPEYLENYLVPGSQAVTSEAHRRGLLIYTHMCSPIEPFLSMGFYNRMGIDLFETLSMPPVGNVESLAQALRETDPSICTRGNIGLDLLLNGSADEVRRAVRRMVEEARGRKHILAASDYLFYNIPEENVIAFCDEAAKAR